LASRDRCVCGHGSADQYRERQQPGARRRDFRYWLPCQRATEPPAVGALPGYRWTAPAVAEPEGLHARGLRARDDRELGPWRLYWPRHVPGRPRALQERAPREAAPGAAALRGLQRLQSHAVLEREQLFGSGRDLGRAAAGSH